MFMDISRMAQASGSENQGHRRDATNVRTEMLLKA